MKSSVLIAVLVTTGAAAMPVAGAHARNPFRPVSTPVSWGPSTNTAKGVDAWRAAEDASARRSFHGLHGEGTKIVLRLELSYIDQAAEAMRRSVNWSTTEPWIVAHEPMPALCSSPAAELTAVFAIGSLSGARNPIHDLETIHRLPRPGPDLACSYWVPSTPANGTHVGTKFSLVFVPDASGMLVGNVLGRVDGTMPRPAGNH